MKVSLHRSLLLSLLCFCFCPLRGIASSLPFLTVDLEEAQSLAYQKDKLFFLYFTADWCMPCRWMEEVTFQDPDLLTYVSANYLAIKVDISTPEGKLLQAQFSVTSLPSILVFDALGHLVDQREASQEATPLLRWLKRLDKPAHHLDPRLHTPAVSAPALDSPQAELGFSRPALLPEEDITVQEPAFSQVQVLPDDELLIVYAAPNDNQLFTPRSGQRYGIQLTGQVYNYSEGVQQITEMERKHQQRTELHPVANGQFQLLIGNFESNVTATDFLHYLQRNNQPGKVIPLRNH